MKFGLTFLLVVRITSAKAPLVGYFGCGEIPSPEPEATMNDTPTKVVISNGLRNFVSGGGTLGIRGVEGETGQLNWDVVAVSSDGEVFNVLEFRQGRQRRLLTPSTAFSFLSRHHPEASRITIPARPGLTCFVEP